ncbi:hypothetical protein ACEO96_18625 [Vibrio anguillarum]|uniref:hypothetical protein n=1 Tax=Vibrio anguillarum TaxID=55601 RepID=UPI00359467A0
MGLIKNKNLLVVAKDWCMSAPFLKRKPIAITVSGSVSYGCISSSTISIRKTPKTTEEHLLYLQEQIDWLKEDLLNSTSQIKGEMLEIKNDTAQKHSISIKTTNEITKKLENISIGSLKSQIFGVLLMCYGSIISYFA